MNPVFLLTGAVAIIASALAITRVNAVHALLYLIMSLLAVALVFFLLGAPFAAALEVIIYAGAIMVLFVFAIMLLNLGEAAAEQERQWLSPGIWLGPGVLAAILLGELAYLLTRRDGLPFGGGLEVGPKQVGIVLFGPYVLGVELASFLLLAGLVGAYHLGRERREGAEP